MFVFMLDYPTNRAQIEYGLSNILPTFVLDSMCSEAAQRLGMRSISCYIRHLTR